MSSRSRILTGVLALCVLALPAASLAHEGHEHSQGQTAGAPAGDPNATSQAQDEAAAEQTAARRKMADEDAAKAKAEEPTPVAPRDDGGQH